MAFDFPNAPVTNDEFTQNGKTYIWDGIAWLRKPSGATGTPPPVGFLPLTGGTMTGAIQLVPGAPVAATEATNKNWVETRTIDGGAYTMTAQFNVKTGSVEFGRNYLPRWSINAGEGDNADFEVKRFNDGGGAFKPVIKASRQTGVVDFGEMPTIKGKSLLEYLK
jgi:hypothetical protein